MTLGATDSRITFCMSEGDLDRLWTMRRRLGRTNLTRAIEQCIVQAAGRRPCMPDDKGAKVNQRSTVVIGKELVDQLDEWREELGISRSAALRAMVHVAQPLRGMA